MASAAMSGVRRRSPGRSHPPAWQPPRQLSRRTRFRMVTPPAVFRRPAATIMGATLPQCLASPALRSSAAVASPRRSPLPTTPGPHPHALPRRAAARGRADQGGARRVPRPGSRLGPGQPPGGATTHERRRYEGAGECEQPQGDELRPDAGAGTASGGRDRRAVACGGRDRRGRGRAVEAGGPGRRVAGGVPAAGGSSTFWASGASACAGCRRCGASGTWCAWRRTSSACAC